MASTDALQVIGFFLTLVSLLGSFFYIHLSDWLRDVIALDTKWQINKTGVDQRPLRFECCYEVEKVADWTTLVTSVMVTIFIFFIFGLGASLWLTQPEQSVGWTYVGLAGVGFIIIYAIMTIYLLGRGYKKALHLRNEIRAHKDCKYAQ